MGDLPDDHTDYTYTNRREGLLTVAMATVMIILVIVGLAAMLALAVFD